MTCRKAAYTEPDRFFSVSGFINPVESEHDIFSIGHTSTAVSLACGLTKGRDVKEESGNVIAVIGDGALSGGEALEGLNNAVAFASGDRKRFLEVIKKTVLYVWRFIKKLILKDFVISQNDWIVGKFKSYGGIMKCQRQFLRK